MESPMAVNDDANATIDVDCYTNIYKDAYTKGYVDGYSTSEMSAKKPIAIVGMSCRLPGNISTPEEFWELCSRARSGWSEIPKERFDSNSFYHPNAGKSGCHNAVGGCFLKEDVGLFDAPFFGLTASEAISMDPIQRLLLECTFEALENAGIPKQRIVRKKVGVFIGGSPPEYEYRLFADTDTIPMHEATGCSSAMQSNRISHFFDLQGPSLTIDTACSSSLVAVHEACRSLQNGESELAIVGGCHLNMLPEFWVTMAKSRLFSNEGRSFSFDNRGTGYGRGEGCGIVILKSLEQAQKDNDVIRAIIAASGINQDGRTPGITMPNASAQESLMKSVYKNAGISPTDTGYIEAHGTGTKVGDPIEATAIHNVFSEGRSARNPLFIGSVKSNIGHLEAASGIVSVIKTTMMLERGFILPNYDFKKPNEKIPLSQWNLKVPVTQRPWPKQKRFASVNNFGFGGTNAHIVLEHAPFVQDHQTSSAELTFQPRKLFVLSAHDKNTAEKLMSNVTIYLERRPEIFQNDLMSNLAYTLGQRRSFMQYRVAISATSSFDLIKALNTGKISPAQTTEEPSIGFVFTGQGAQWNAMGRELYQQFPVFSLAIDACDRCLVSLGAPFSLIEELNKDASTSRVNEAHISQPACTAIQLALTDLLQAWGVSPAAVTGHSSGEIAAVYAAGILSLESCIALSYHRGMATINLEKKFPKLRGSMMAVGCSEEEIMPLIAQLTITGKVNIACFNSPNSLTISGDEAAIDELQALLQTKEIFNRKLHVNMAYHSHHMDLVAESYLQAIQSINLPKSTDVKFSSSLLGHVVDGSEIKPSYWVENLTKPVRFTEALKNMCEPMNGQKLGVNIIIEIGPHSALAGPVKQILRASGPEASKIAYGATLVRNKDAAETMMELAGMLFVKKVALDLNAINSPRPCSPPELLADMPRYPWNHQTKYWHESRFVKKHNNRPTARNDLIGTIASYSNDLEPIWRNILCIDDLPWLRHHKVQSLTLFPISGFITMAVEAASQRANLRHMEYDGFFLRNVAVVKPLMISENDVEVTLQLRPHQESSTLVASNVWDEFRIHSWTTSNGWTEHCKGLITTECRGSDEVDGDGNTGDLLHDAITKITSAQQTPVDKTMVYNSLSDLGVSYGPSFQGMDNCQINDECSVADITVMDTAEDMPEGYQTSMVIHPTFLEQLIETYWLTLGAGQTPLDTIYLTSSIRRLHISRDIANITNTPGNTLRAFCKGSRPQSHLKPVQMSMFAITGNDSKKVINLDDLTISPIPNSDMTAEIEGPYKQLCYKLDWEPILQPLNCLTSDSLSNGHTCESLNHVNGVTNGITNGLTNGVTNSTTNDAYRFLEKKLAIVHSGSECQEPLLSKLSHALERLIGAKPDTGTLTDLDTDKKICLFLPELEKPLLPSVTPTQFCALQKMLTGVDGILWVVRGAYFNSRDPDANMVTGLSRSIRSERLLKFATLDLDSECVLSTEDTAKAILEVFKAAFGPEAELNCELEFREKNGRFFTPRVIDDAEMNAYVGKKAKGPFLVPTLFCKDSRPLKLTIETPGMLETLHFVDDHSTEEPLPDDEIEVEVKAIGVNSKDDSIPAENVERGIFGIECSGIITKVGNTISKFTVGDRVACISVSQGVYSSYTRTKAGFAFRINDDMSFETAAAIPVAYCTAYYGLIQLGQLQEDDSILIHGAASIVGQAVISLSRMIGANIFATVETIESKEALKNVHGLLDDHIFSSRGLLSGHRERKESRFDVVLNCLPVDNGTITELWDRLDNFGRFVEIGQQSSNIRLETTSFANNRSFMSVDLISVAVEKQKLMKRLVSNVSELVNGGRITPNLPVKTFPISNVETMFRLLKGGHQERKLVILPQPDDEVMAPPSNKSEKLLSADGIYILIGGTGGLGRSMARWMAGKGAKNIVLVSRSGTASGKVKQLIDEVASSGVNILVQQCDVSDAESVRKLIEVDLGTMPPVKGVIHGAMVLHDVLFEKMAYHEYTEVVKSKVQGAWNFHHALNAVPLDFFVVLSSAAGTVGNRGQAAYSAANTFLNAFVQHRITLKLPASSIDLTAVSDAGYLAENLDAAAEVARNLGSDTICEVEVLALLEAAIDGHLALTCNSHSITGVRITSPAPFWTDDAKFKHARLAAEAAVAGGSDGQAVAISFNDALRATQSLEEARNVVCNGLKNKISSVLMLDMEDMDVTASLSNYALDSLVAIEVRNFITREFEANLQVLELLSSGSIETLAQDICTKSKLVSF